MYVRPFQFISISFVHKKLFSMNSGERDIWECLRVEFIDWGREIKGKIVFWKELNSSHKRQLGGKTLNTLDWWTEVGTGRWLAGGVRQTLACARIHAGKCMGVQTWRMHLGTWLPVGFAWLKQRSYVGENGSEEEEMNLFFPIWKG